MKYLNFLNWFIIILIVIFILHIATGIYLGVFPPDFMNFPENIYKNFIFGFYTQFVVLGFSVITLTGLFFVQNGLRITLREGVFNKSSGFQFKSAGKLLLISGVLSLTFNLFLLFNSSSSPYFGVLVQDFLLIIGFGLYIIADIIQNGNILQQENDLMI